MELEKYSKQLFELSKSAPTSYQLGVTSPLFTLEHPVVVRIKLMTEEELQTLNLPQVLHGFSWSSFASLGAALQAYPQYKVVKGTPVAIHHWLELKTANIIIDFSPIGFLVLHQNPIETARKNLSLDHQISSWFNYATSIELWGPQGKWTRFHERLLKLFNQYHLLVEQSYPGFYRLDPKLNWISSHGFVGEIHSDELQLTLPWDFSLSALKKLEKIIVEN